MRSEEPESRFSGSFPVRFFCDLLFSTTWPALFSGLFPVRFFGQSFIINNFGSFVSASFPVCFLDSFFIFINFPGSFFKKRILFYFHFLLSSNDAYICQQLSSLLKVWPDCFLLPGRFVVAQRSCLPFGRVTATAFFPSQALSQLKTPRHQNQFRGYQLATRTGCLSATPHFGLARRGAPGAHPYQPRKT